METQILFDGAFVPFEDIANINPMDVTTACAFDPHFGAKGIPYSVVCQVRDERLAREGKVYEPDKTKVKPTFKVGNVPVSRTSLLHAIKDVIARSEAGTPIDVEYLKDLFAQANAKVPLEIGLPEGWKHATVHVNKDVNDKDPWVTVRVKDRKEIPE